MMNDRRLSPVEQTRINPKRRNTTIPATRLSLPPCGLISDPDSGEGNAVDVLQVSVSIKNRLHSRTLIDCAPASKRLAPVVAFFGAVKKVAARDFEQGEPSVKRTDADRCGASIQCAIYALTVD